MLLVLVCTFGLAVFGFDLRDRVGWRARGLDRVCRFFAPVALFHGVGMVLGMVALF